MKRLCAVLYFTFQIQKMFLSGLQAERLDKPWTLDVFLIIKLRWKILFTCYQCKVFVSFFFSFWSSVFLFFIIWTQVFPPKLTILCKQYLTKNDGFSSKAFNQQKPIIIIKKNSTNCIFCLTNKVFQLFHAKQSEGGKHSRDCDLKFWITPNKWMAFTPFVFLLFNWLILSLANFNCICSCTLFICNSSVHLVVQDEARGLQSIQVDKRVTERDTCIGHEDMPTSGSF